MTSSTYPHSARPFAQPQIFAFRRTSSVLRFGIEFQHFLFDDGTHYPDTVVQHSQQVYLRISTRPAGFWCRLPTQPTQVIYCRRSNLGVYVKLAHPEGNRRLHLRVWQAGRAVNGKEGPRSHTLVCSAADKGRVGGASCGGLDEAEAGEV